MNASPRTPKLLSGGIVLVDPSSGAVQRIIALQYNPASVQRSLQAQWFEPQQGADRSERLRIKGPPVETIKIEAEIDATDDLEQPDQHATTAELGIQPQLAALETLVFPTSGQLEANNRRASAGTLEIVPMEAPLTLFVWSKQRVMPVRITEFSVAEEFFDTQLNPIQAKVSLGMRVLTVDDVGFDHRGGQFFLHYHKTKEGLARKVPGAELGALGLNRLPV
jgi:hypothetical protein